MIRAKYQIKGELDFAANTKVFHFSNQLFDKPEEAVTKFDVIQKLAETADVKSEEIILKEFKIIS